MNRRTGLVTAALVIGVPIALSLIKLSAQGEEQDLRSHLYVQKDGSTYWYDTGYAELQPARLLASTERAFKIESPFAGGRLVFECTDPCNIADLYAYSGSALVEHSKVRVTAGDLVDQVVSDTKADHLSR